MATNATHTTSAAATVTLAPIANRLRFFVWLSSGMFSMSALALAFVDYWTLGSASQAASHFVAALVSAGMFGLASVFKLGPVQA